MIFYYQRLQIYPENKQFLYKVVQFFMFNFTYYLSSYLEKKKLPIIFLFINLTLHFSLDF